MVAKKEDYSYLLDDLRNISEEYHWDAIGRIVDKEGKEQDDDYIVNKTDFYMYYTYAYRALDYDKDSNKAVKVDRAYIERALTSYGAFNYFINTCVGEYRIYGEIGTGNVTYVPYQPLADYFFNDEGNKEILLDYLYQELGYIFKDETNKRRVK